MVNRNLLCTVCCALAMSVPADLLAQEPTGVSRSTPSNGTATSLTATAELPDSPGALQSQSQDATPQQSSSNSAPSGQTQEQKAQRPVGTAAAEAPKVSGITAAQPAGIAIAPAKQKHARSIVLKVGAIIGGAAAIGAVVALTRATPSKPPGAH